MKVRQEPRAHLGHREGRHEECRGSDDRDQVRVIERVRQDP